MSIRSHWRNCALNKDREIAVIDAMEDRIAPLDENTLKIRELISTFELCHHKADIWIYNVCEAIGNGETTKGLGTRIPGRRHPRETVWENACTMLLAWCLGATVTEEDLLVDTVPASELISGLGARSPLKEWQVRRVIDKIRSFIGWPNIADDGKTSYDWLLMTVGDYEFAYLDRCPDSYKDEEEFWRTTARTLIHDTEQGEATDLSLALAIDMLWPCHWRFVDNLRIVLGAIGGNLHPDVPFAACGRNIMLYPDRQRMQLVCDTLSAFTGNTEPGKKVNKHLLAFLGSPSETKRWLAASLEKTIRLQLDPPEDLRKLSAMSGPEWIRK